MNRRGVLALGIGAAATAGAGRRALADGPVPAAPFAMNPYLWTQTVTPALFPSFGRLRAIGYERERPAWVASSDSVQRWAGSACIASIDRARCGSASA